MISINSKQGLPDVTITLSGVERSQILLESNETHGHEVSPTSGCPLCRLLFLIGNTEDREV